MGVIDSIAKFADPYDRQARLYPALLAVCPLATAAMLILAPHASVLGNVAIAGVGCGLLYWMAGLARARDKRLESRLFKAWGGKPSVQLLRHRNATVNRVTKARLHALLAGRLGVSFPTTEEEQRSPESAGQIYKSATRWLLEQTRDTNKYSLLFTENISYGFRRNMLGLRWIGLACTALAASWLVVDSVQLAPASPIALVDQLLGGPVPHRIGLAACGLFAILWMLGVSAVNVRESAFAYAERLIAACESLEAVGLSGATPMASPAPVVSNIVKAVE